DNRRAELAYRLPFAFDAVSSQEYLADQRELDPSIAELAAERTVWQKDQLGARLRRVVYDPQEIEAVMGDGVTKRGALQIQLTEHAPFDRPLLAQGGRHHHNNRPRVRVLDRDARSDRERRVGLPQTDLVGQDLSRP